MTSCCTPEKAIEFHPLNPLTAAETAQAVALFRKAKKLGDTFRFVELYLEEPTKQELNADSVQRKACATLLNTKNGATFQSIANLTTGKIEKWHEHDTKTHPYGQPMVIIEEFFKTAEIVKADKNWRNAMYRRGLTDADIELVQADPFTAGYFAREAEIGKRLVSAIFFYRESIRDNGYSHPIEGVVALVDLINGNIAHLYDDEVIIPIPKKKHNYGRENFTPRKDLKPLNIVQPEGVSFKVESWKVSWQDWDFRVGFTPREGLVLHQVNIKNRPVIHRASITEMAVPYADPTTNSFWKCAFDAGDYGLGKLANALELGCDCLGAIHYFDVESHDDFGAPMVMKNAICLHEEDYGILWKHYEFRNEIYESRRSRRLAISFFSTVGNYDYGFYWYLYLDGTIQFEAKLTGIIQTVALPPNEKYKWGGMVTPELGGPTHQHFFSARLHMAVDGEGNSISEHEFVPRKTGADNPYGNIFDTTSVTFKHEREAIREANGATGRYWKISNPNKMNIVGNAPAYKLAVHHAPVLLAQEGSFIHQRAGFATKHLWVTPFAPNEKYASGEFPNQHAGGDGLPKYVQQNRKIENSDLVVWHSFGHTHVCKPEDFPIMPVEYTGFTLKPNGFFDGSIVMDLPADANAGSVKAGCCD